VKAGWELKTLGESCRVFTDGNWIETKDQSTEGIRLVQTGNVGLGVFKDRRDKARFISENTFRDLKCFEVLPGDCLISRLPEPVGRACEIPETDDRMITAVDCSIVRTDPQKMDRNYFIYFSQSRAYLNEVDSLCSGTTRRRISRKNLGKIGIPLPPLEEQKRIVSILDETFEGLDRARENAEANLKSARELFEGFVGTKFNTDAADAAGYRLAPLSKLAKLSYGFTEKAVTEPIGPKFLRITDIKEGKVDWTSVPYCKIDDKLKPKYLLKTGDIVFARTGATTGKSYLVEEVSDAIYASYLIRLQMSSNDLSASYLSFYFQTAQYWENVKAGIEGAAQGGFNASKLGAMIIPVPPLEVQKSIVDMLREQEANNHVLQATYNTKLQDISDLRQSLLQKAFAGELT
jgi:type I restriction enzyme S subunit